jgi:hypothetical protein
MILPIGFCSIISVSEILDRQPVKLLLLSQSLYDIPTQPIHIDPSAFDPALLWPGYESDKSSIVKIVDIDVVLAEVHNGDLTFFVEIWRLGSSAIRFRWVEPWLLSWMPVWS